MARVVAEFDQCRGFVERLDDDANLATDELVLRQVAEERNSAKSLSGNIILNCIIFAS